MNEHFSPADGTDLEACILAGDIDGVHHLARYLWLADALATFRGVSTVLDAGCGAGYGAHLLATKFPQIIVTAVDYDPDAIREAAVRFAAPNLTFRVGDLMDWRATIGDEHFDLIVSFDVIEHIPHREVAMENIVSHLSGSGRLVLSTPCGTVESTLTPDWSAHRIEYGTASLYAFVRRYFRVIRRPDNLTLPTPNVFTRLNASGIHYLNRLNPLIAESPIRVWNPYLSSANRFMDTLSLQRVRDWRNLRDELMAKLRYRLRQTQSISH